MSTNKVTIYTTSTCVYCKMAKAFFKENNISYEEKDVGVDAKAREEMIQKSGQLGVPVIEIDGKVGVGFNKEKLTKILNIS